MGARHAPVSFTSRTVAINKHRRECHGLEPLTTPLFVEIDVVDLVVGLILLLLKKDADAVVVVVVRRHFETGEMGAKVREHYSLLWGDDVLRRGQGGGGQDAPGGGGAGGLSCGVHR